MKKSSKSLKALIFFLIIIDAIIFWYIFQPRDFKENVVVTNLNDVKSENKIPINFPSNIYIEKDNIIDSYVMEYLDRGVRISGVTYISQKNSNEIYDTYDESLTKIYNLNQNESKRDQGIMYYTKDKDTLNILININTPEENKTTVQLVYTQNSAK